MEIIDAHAHVYEYITGYGPRGEARPIGGGMVEWANGDREKFLSPAHGDKGFSAETLLRLMDEGGISRAVLLQACNYGFQNSYVAEAVRNHPDRFVGAGAFDPYAASAAEIFAHLTQNLGFRILKFEMSYGYGLTGYHPALKLDGAELAPHFAAAEAAGVAIVVDTGSLDTAGCQVEELCRLRDRHPKLALVLAHAFFPSLEDRDGRNAERLELVKRLAGERVYFDMTKATEGRFLRAVMDAVGAERMMWGTDCPGVFMHRTYRQLTESVMSLASFTEQELSHLMGGTAKRVYQMA